VSKKNDENELGGESDKQREVFRRHGEKRSLWKNLVKRRGELIGYLLRHEELLKTTIEGSLEGKNYRRPTLAYIKQIIKDVVCTVYVEMKRLAVRRAEWRTVATNTWTDDEKKKKNWLVIG
jgi:hypothetical protein